MDAVDAVLAANKLTKRLGGGAVDVDQPYTTKNFSARVDGDTYGDDSFDIIKEMDEFMDRERLKKIAADARKAYKTARPFPNHVFDGIFPERMLRKVMEENPETLLVDGCLPGSEACLKGSYEGQQHKSSINNDKQMGIFTKSFFGYIKSSGFVHFLEELSQINGLIPDPHYFGAGLHFTSPGGKLDIHADFNALVSHKLERRVNTLLFLNDDWPSEYGGHLELWSRDMQHCSQKVTPKLGRLAVFSTTDFSYHGHPHPLEAPAGRARRSIAMYYYTTKRPVEECLDECSFQSEFKRWHTTLFQTPKCNQCDDESVMIYQLLILGVNKSMSLLNL
eukprot:g3651.t1 g3651   contig12:2495443-2496638(+)